MGTAVGLRPWRCEACQRRFYAWTAPPRLMWLVHCGHCGSFELRRISTQQVATGATATVLRWLGLRAYRCTICRHHFRSVRSFRALARASNKIAPAKPAAESKARN